MREVTSQHRVRDTMYDTTNNNNISLCFTYLILLTTAAATSVIMRQAIGKYETSYR